MNPDYSPELDGLPELDWRAFLYVADELDASEREAFEEQLAVDQAAREAVARAVEITQTLSAAHELGPTVQRSSPNDVSTIRPGRSAWLRPLAFLSAGAAACLALVAIWSVWSALGRPGNSATDQNALALAQAWSSAREEQSDEENAWDGELATLGAIRLDEEPLEDLDGLPAPSWMLSAVATENAAPEGEREN